MNPFEATNKALNLSAGDRIQVFWPLDKAWHDPTAPPACHRGAVRARRAALTLRPAGTWAPSQSCAAPTAR